MTRVAVRCVVWLGVAALASAPLRAEEEAPGPLPGWLDARRDFGASGDGRADDTAALQKALDRLRDDDRPARTLYLPAGTYRLTRTLALARKGAARHAIGLSIQGEHPDRTALKWDGAQGGVMLDYGAWYSRLGRITFDGAGKAGTALKHGPEFATANELADLAFRDVGFGIEAGDMARAGIAETSVLRCRFTRCTRAGLSIQNFNTLDWYVWHARFEDCRLGVTNSFGAGNFHVYASLFERSTEADVSIGNTAYFGLRDNTSIGSKAFFVAGGIGAGAQLTFQGNTIVDPIDAQAIRVGNLGPVLLLDNTIASRKEAAAGPVAAGANARAIAVGNTFTVPLDGATAFAPGSRVVDNRTVSRGSLTLPPTLTLPGAPPRRERPVIEVEGADGEAIARALERADGLRGQRPVVHLRAARYEVRSPLTIRAGSDVTVLGEGIPDATTLAWAGEGEGPVLRLAGPSRATLRDFAIDGGGRADALSIDDADGAGGLVYLDQVQVAGCKRVGFRVEDVKATTVRLHDIGHSDCALGVRVAGAGEPVVIWSGASANNVLSYEVADGGRLIVRDIWYENGQKARFLHLTDRGEFTLHDANVAHPRKKDEPALLIEGFRGRVALLGVCFTQVGGDVDAPAVVVRGESDDLRTLLLGCHGTGEYLARPGSRATRLASVQYTEGGGARPIEDVGTTDDATLLKMLAPTRGVRRLDASPRPPGVTDARLHRVFLKNARDGITIRPPGPRPPGSSRPGR